MAMQRRVLAMTYEKTYELAEATYPLTVAGGAGVTIAEEIRCLLDAGWTWDGDKLVHPQYRELWRMYKKMDSPKLGDSRRLDAEIEQAVREAGWRELRKQGGRQ
jgi:hypothetical protein